ncbi:NUDIX domain-containing protein [Streptomyces sp. NPDC006475]|uniref:NUDIX domain-containing protein n=1 Tax=Streptomyces sp. NPDC006475 TaxID=3155719 RepID=UPI0033B25FA8
MTDPVPDLILPQHRLGLYERYYAQVESGRRTIEVRVHTPRMTGVAVGDVLMFHGEESGRELDVRATRITPYASFAELLAAEDISRIDPDAARVEQLINLRRLYPPEKESLGLLAIEFDHRPALTAQPMPLSAEAYVRTVPHHTVYGCFYVRDDHDRLVQLRSVYGGRAWQFPGGNTDAGEDPLETARRETAEETGLHLGQGQPRLLLTHYLHPGPRWPLGKVGFIFDGGTLTAEQLRQIRLDRPSTTCGQATASTSGDT